MYKGSYFEVSNFGGGYAGNLPDTQIALNQAADLDNIVIKPQGLGFRSRYGDDRLGNAFRIIQDLTYVAVAAGVAGEAVTITYTTGVVSAGSEVCTVIGSAISIAIASSTSTATQVKTAFDANAAATALASCTISGTAGTAQTSGGVTTLALATPLNSAAAIQGTGYYLQEDGDDWIMAVAGNKLYANASLTGGQFTDITGSLTITAGADKQWDIFTFGNNVLGFGGSVTSPDAPWTWTGSSVATALGGTPPSAYGAFTANNRVFAYRTATDPSTVYWSIIGSGADWTGAGSGSAVIGSFSDNQKVTGACVISTNYVLVFKENSTYQMVIGSAPFPVYSLFDNVGAAGKKAIVNVDGVVYFITSKGEMKSTNGETLTSYPAVADDLWGAVSPSRYAYINGFRYQGTDHDWLVWSVSTNGTSNNTSIVWDIANSCWLKCSTGFKYNVSSSDTFGNVYAGGYDGYVYKPFQSTRHADASEASTGAIAAFWQSGWMNPDNLNKITQVRKFTALLTPQASGSVTLAYGFDGTANSASTTLSQVASGSEQYLQKSAMLSGRGNTFEFKVSLSSSTIGMEMQRIILAGKVYGQKGQAQE